MIIPVLIFGLLAFFAVSWFKPSYWNWSVLNPNLSMPIGFAVIAFVALITIVPSSSGILLRAITRCFGFLRDTFARLPAFVVAAIWLAISAGILYLCRGFTYLYGDGHLIISHIEKGSMISTTAYGFSLLIKFSSRILHINSWIGPAEFMAWISIICGVVYLYFLYKILALLVDNIQLRPVFFLIAATSAIIVLFTGYIETYSILTAWLAIYLYYSLKFMKGRGNAFVLILMFVVGIFWHIWFVAFMPALLYALNQRYRVIPGKYIVGLSSLYELGIIVGGRLISRSGIPPIIPVFPNSQTSYSLISPSHLIDFLNIMIMAGPVMIVLGLLLAVMYIGRRFEPDVKLLIFAGIPAFTIAIFLDPALGAVRDWDVLSIFALPIILVGIALLWQYLKQLPGQASILVPILILGILHAGTFIAYNKKTDLAVDRMIRILKDDPHYSDSYYEGERILPFSTIISNVYERHKEGAEFMQRRTLSASGNYWDQIQLAYQYYNQKDYEDALKCFNQTPIEDISDFEARYCYASTLFHLDEFKKSAEMLSALAEDTGYVGVYFLLSGCMMMEGNYDSSFQTAIHGIRYAPDTVEYANDLFKSLYLNEKYETALRFQKVVYRLRPEVTDFALSLGIAYEALDRADSAQKYYELTLQKEPANLDALLGMAYVRYEKGDYAGTLEKLKRLGEANPRNADIMYWTARCLSKLGRTMDALGACAAALQISPNHTPVRNLAAQELYSLGQYSQAIQEWRQVLLLDSDDPTALLGLAKAYDRTGNRTEAWQMLKRWKDSHPDSPVDSQTMALMEKYKLND